MTARGKGGVSEGWEGGKHTHALTHSEPQADAHLHTQHRHTQTDRHEHAHPHTWLQHGSGAGHSYRESQQRQPCDGQDVNVELAFRQHLERCRLREQAPSPRDRLPVLCARTTKKTKKVLEIINKFAVCCR